MAPTPPPAESPGAGASLIERARAERERQRIEADIKTAASQDKDRVLIANYATKVLETTVAPEEILIQDAVMNAWHPIFQFEVEGLHFEARRQGTYGDSVQMWQRDKFGNQRYITRLADLVDGP